MTNYVCDYQADYEQCLSFLTFKVLLNFAEVSKTLSSLHDCFRTEKGFY